MVVKCGQWSGMMADVSNDVFKFVEFFLIFL